MNAARRIGLVSSGALHGFLALILMKPALPQPSAPDPPTSVHVVQVDAADLAGVTNQTFDFDVEKIRARGGSLFPFAEGEPLHSQFASHVQGGIRDSSTRASIVERTLVQPPLKLTDDQLRHLLDRSWSRRRRWSAFKPIADAASHYHPERGDLPLLLRGYADQNSLQPFAVSSWSPEAKVWALLSIAADHADFVEFISQYIARFPSSRSAAELLFLLDKVVQANLEALIALMKIDPLVDLAWTAAVNPQAAQALSALHLYHQERLERRGLWNIETLRRKYNDVRVTILRHLVGRTTQKQRDNDALFNLGEIYWRQGKFSEAVSWWVRIVPHPSDSTFAASSEVLREITTTDTFDRERITAALDANKVRWVDASFMRLRQFGYRFDTF